jgi:hypothetical protein
MQVTLKISAKVGKTPDFAFTINGEEFLNRKYQVSRLMTETTTETEAGIFSGGNIRFQRNNEVVNVHFPSPLHPCDMSANECLAELKKRADMVHAAFAEKYPERNDVAEMEYQWTTAETTYKRDNLGRFVPIS